ncbi:MAG: BrnT family toxin [Verrucomicrobiota bacterium]
MEFNWLDTPFDLRKISPKEIEESFEDPFSLRLLPDGTVNDSKARYFNLGKSLSEHGIFSVFWTDGKNYRVILAREMAPEELSFYDRKNSELNL